MLRHNSAKVSRHSQKKHSSPAQCCFFCCEEFTLMHIKAAYEYAFSHPFVYLFVGCVGVC